MPEARVVTFSNEKGGVGKTACAVHTAAGLAAQGRKVLLIDSDPQGHATTLVGHPKAGHLYDLLARSAPFRQVMKPVAPEFYGSHEPKSRLMLIAGNVETYHIGNVQGNMYVLAERLQEVRQLFDTIIIDTSPTPSLLHAVIYLATDYIVYPTVPEYLSLDGLVESMTHLDSFRTLREVQIAGIQPTMVREQTWEHRDLMERLGEKYEGLIWESITRSIIWPEAARARLPVFVYNPTHQASEQVWTMVRHIEELSA